MPRLTFEWNFCDIAMCRENPCPYNGMCSHRQTWERLKAYEDAEQDGRLVLLPCGTDVELERDGNTFKADHWNHTLTAFRDAPENKSGKQVALFSIEEAEAALAQKGGTNEDSGGL